MGSGPMADPARDLRATATALPVRVHALAKETISPLCSPERESSPYVICYLPVQKLYHLWLVAHVTWQVLVYPP